MIKKIDKLVLKAFWAPFITTLAVVIFILLMRVILAYFTELFGKDLGLQVYLNLFGYFTLISVPVALPLAMLLASLMSFGNLGEFSELIAIKSAGISMNRVLRPMTVVAILMSIFAVWFNNTVSPWANLKGFRLLYDIKTTKATLNIKEGIFYTGIPGYSIKANKKFRDNKTLKGVIIYDHSQNQGNNKVTTADSAQMYSILGKQYLIFELYNGYDFVDDPDKSNYNADQSDFASTKFIHSKMVFDLSSFNMAKTGEEQFTYHPLMKNFKQLNNESDSLKSQYNLFQKNVEATARQYYLYQFKSVRKSLADSLKGKWIDSLATFKPKDIRNKQQVISAALGQARNLVSFVDGQLGLIISRKVDYSKMDLEWHHKITQAIAVFLMFLIGAPLGSIIRKGGFGMPVILAITFFILMYVMTINGDKWAKELLVPVIPAVWFSNAVLGLFGIYFLVKARNDSRLFEADVYRIWFEKMKGLILTKSSVLKNKLIKVRERKI